MKQFGGYHWSFLTVGFAALGLFLLGISWLDVPPIYRLTHHSPLIVYRGYVALGLAGLLVCAYRWVIQKMLWLSLQIHRWLSAVAMLSVVGIDATMHMLSIPHMEGWWLPLLSGSGLISSSFIWLKRKAASKDRQGNCD